MHNGCVLTGDVGTGKTITALAYALLREPGRKIYVITTAKVRDGGSWEREAAGLAIPFDDLVVDSWNNIAKYVGVEGALFIFDEQRLVGTGAWVKSFYKIASANRWVLLTATPGDTWLDYVPVFIANGFYKNITEFRQMHVIYARFSKFPKVDRYINPGLLQRRRSLVLVEMPMERHTTRHIKMVETEYDHELFEKVWKKRWHVYEERPLKDAGELFRVGRKVVNSDATRLAAVKELLQTHPKLIVFYNFDYELEMLRELGKELSESPTSPTRTFSGFMEENRSGASQTSEKPKTESSSTTHSTLTLSTRLVTGQDEPTVSKKPGRLTESAVAANTSERSSMNESLSSSPRTETPSSRKQLSYSTSFSRIGTDRLSPTNGLGLDRNLGQLDQTALVLDAPLDSAMQSGAFIEQKRKSANTMSQSTITTQMESSTASTVLTAGKFSSGSSMPESNKDVKKSSISSESAANGASPNGIGRNILSAISRQEMSFAVAEWNGHKHEPIPETDSWIYLVQYTSGSEGWNCIETDAVVFYSLTYSYKQFYQAQGRTDRMNTKYSDLFYYVLMSRSIVDKAVWRALKAKKDFNVRAYKL